MAKERLPQDLIHEILVRLPAKSLIRFQLCSKQWQSLIFNPVFTRSHLQFNSSKYPPLSILIHPGPSRSVSSLKFGANNSVESTKLDSLKQLHISKKIYDYVPFGSSSSEGLICLYNLSTKRIYLWNPTTKQHRLIPAPEINESNVIEAFGFGFVPSINDYKIVMLACRERKMGTWIAFIYTLRDDKWRELAITLPIPNTAIFQNDGQISTSVLCNQALHWVGLGPGPYLNSEQWYIFKFDLVKEGLEEVPLAEQMYSTRCHLAPPSTGVVEPNNLAVCLLYWSCPNPSANRFVELWKLERYGEWDSWNKLFKFDFGLEFTGNFLGTPNVLGVASCGNVLVEARNRLAFVNATCDRLIYVLEDDLDKSKRQYPTFVVNYVPSLASLYP